jgi:hypothetical protein
MALDFNVDPYYDDFDTSKNFHRILFKPGYAVQARELTQSQTILQDQVSKFAANIFTQNTPVTGGKVTTNLASSYVKLNSTYLGSDIDVNLFLNKTITNATGTVTAKVLKVVQGTGTNVTVGDPPTLIVSYFSGVKFTDAEIIGTVDTGVSATTIGTAGGTSCTGYASIASISEGVFYVVNGFKTSTVQNEDGTYSKFSVGNFVSVQPQTVVLDKYGIRPSVRVGLNIVESIVNYTSDASLLDQAVGASNYQAPGADRYKISLNLTTLPLTPGSDSEFIELVRIENGQITKQVDGTVYSSIDDYFAKRDFETNGNYVVNDFKLTPETDTGNSDYYNIKISKGVAYVGGYRIENQSDLTLRNSRARTTDTVIGNDIYIDYGNYFFVDTVNGLFDVTTIPSVDLHCVPTANINSANSATYNSTLVGTGIIKNLSYVSDSGSTITTSYVFKSYVSDINNHSLSASATSGSTSTQIHFNPGQGEFSACNTAYVGATIAITGGTSSGDIRKITAYNGVTKVATVDSAFTVTPDATSIFSILFGTNNVGSVVQKTSSSNYTLVSSSNINTAQGRVNGLSTGDSIYNIGTDAELIFKLGSPYISNLTNTTYRSTKVFRNKTFTNLGGSSSLTISMPSGNSLKFAGTGTLSGDAVKQLFTVVDSSNGKILNFATSGNTVSIVSGTSATFTSAQAAGKTVNIIVNDVDVADAQNSNYVLKSKNFVNGNTSVVSTFGPDGNINSNTFIDLTKGQVYIKNAVLNSTTSLYVSDVKSIIKIIDTKDSSVVPTTDMLSSPAYDVTNLFTLDNGQRDTYYDHASISLIPGANKPKGNILVIFNFYTHSGGDGYFSVNSYLPVSKGGISTSPENYAEIGTYTAKNGDIYDLTNSVDFRPSVKNAQANFVFEYTGNPSSDDTGVLIPNNLSDFIGDYSYYLARKDKLVLTKDKQFLIINGSPAIVPTFPVEPDGALVLAELNHDPYTAYIPGETPKGVTPNLSINKITNKRWTMADITDLETRVNNLEYYTSLSLLEQKTQTLQVPDSNGLNRFKNGILVDSFSDYSTADTYNNDFSANINVRKNQLLPLNNIQNYQLQNPVVLNSLGTVKSVNNYQINTVNGNQTNIFTLPYTTSTMVSQPLASNVLSVNPFALINQQGILSLNPPMDNWVDTNSPPSILTNSPAFQISGLNFVRVGDFASIIGTPLTSSVANALSGSNQTSTYILSLSNGYVINNSVLPYVRQQQTIVKAKGLLTNTPISVWFDGKNVNQYMTTPNTIELNGVTGTFNENDIIGFYYDNRFHPIGMVISVQTYAVSITQQITNAYIEYLGRTPDASGLAFWVSAVSRSSISQVIYAIENSDESKNYAKTGIPTLPAGSTAAPLSDVVKPVRLYVATISGYIAAPADTNLQNAIFDTNGNYASSTANGVITGKVLNLHTSGTISGVGGSANTQIYKTMDPNNWGTFLNQYGVWGDVVFDTNGNSTNDYNDSFSVTFPSNDVYTFTAAASGSATISLNSSPILTSTSPTTTSVATASITFGVSTVSIAATNSSRSAGVGLIITNSSGAVIFDSTNPQNAHYSNIGSSSTFNGGGTWFTGVTQLKLDPNASANNDFYVGGQISITSSYVQEDKVYATTTGYKTETQYQTVTNTVPVEHRTGYSLWDYKNDTAVYNVTYDIPANKQGDYDFRVSTIGYYIEWVAAEYRTHLGRLPETGGLHYWTQELINNGGNYSQTQANIIAAAQGDGEPVVVFPGTAPSVNRNGVIAGDIWDVPDTVTYTYTSSTSSVPVSVQIPYTYNYDTGNVNLSTKTYTYTANVVSYNGTTKVATLDNPVNISFGQNSRLGNITSTYNINGTELNVSSALQTGAGVPKLSTDETGTYIGIFNIPGGKIPVGQKTFRVDNRTNYSLPTSATTFAEGTFFASSLSDKISQSEYSSSFDSASTVFTEVSKQNNQSTKPLSVYSSHDPLAQTFIISKENYPNGAFISSLKLFFANKPSQNIPVAVSIVGTLNGSPNGNVLDHSTVILDSNKVNVSSTPHYLDSTTYTEFMFDAPVYIKSGTMYAILVESNSSEYQLYVARQNELALTSTSKALPTDTNPTTSSKIGNIPYVGNIFESQNSITWVPNVAASMMFVIDRCVFDTQIVNNSVPFTLPKNSLSRKLTGKEVQYKLNSNTVSGLFGSLLVPQESHEYNITTTDFVPTGTTLSYTYQSLYENGGTPTLTNAVGVTPGKYGCPNPENISLNDGLGPRVIDPYSNDSFTLYANMSTIDDAVSPIISDDGTSVYNVQYLINDLGIGNNVITLTNGGSGYNVACTYATISSPEYGTAPSIGLSIVDGVVKNVFVEGGFTGSGYITTPTISIVDANSSPGTGATVVVSGETSQKGGNALAKYITKKVTLTPQNDSGDLRVFTTAYYPFHSNILVYYKILNRNDTQNFDDGNWQLMTQVTNVNAYSKTNNDLLELEFAPGTNNMADNSISYVGLNGQTYNNFSQFAIKVVFATNDNTAIPYLTDLRVLALPSGTGI